MIFLWPGRKNHIFHISNNYFKDIPVPKYTFGMLWTITLVSRKKPPEEKKKHNIVRNKYTGVDPKQHVGPPRLGTHVKYDAFGHHKSEVATLTPTPYGHLRHDIFGHRKSEVANLTCTP